MARGAFPDSHELCLGMPGMHGNYTAVTSMQRADLLVALGARFDDRVTGKLAAFAPDAKIVHVDVDPAEIGKNRMVDVPIVGDCLDVIAKLATELAKRQGDAGRTRSECLAGTARRLAAALPAALRPGARRAQAAVLRRAASLRSPTTTRSSWPVWASTRCTRRSTGRSSGRGTGSTPAVSARWGSPCPAAMGAKAGQPDKRVVAIDGDGCFQMTAQELATSNTENIPFVTAILNNGYLGMVRQWQELFFDERYSGVYLNPDVPDYVKLAEAYGAVGLRADSPEEVDAVIEKAYAVEDRSVVIDFRVDPREGVFPMVPAGASNDDIILGPEFAPHETPGEAPIV